MAKLTDLKLSPEKNKTRRLNIRFFCIANNMNQSIGFPIFF
jgi:hypothetical protein